MTRRILVLGADITAGRCVSTALAAVPSIECVIGSYRSDKERLFAEQIGAGVVEVNSENAASVRKALDGVFAVVRTSGPFQRGKYRVAEQCAKCAVHYVDLASTREYVTGITALNAQAEAGACLIVAGATSVPAISGALVDSLVDEFDRLSEIHVAVSPTDASASWLATARAMLPYVGRPIRVRQLGRWRYTYAWSEPQTVEFPAPTGRQRVYLCDVPDLDLFPVRYGALTVSVRAGLRTPLLNYGLAALGRFNRRRHAAAVAAKRPGPIEISGGFQNLVDKTAGVRVRVHGQRDGVDVCRAACLIARNRSGAAISCSPAIALIKKWVRDGVPRAGAIPCLGLLSLEALKAELSGHDVVLVRS